MPANSRKWDRRIQRAGELSETHPFAREILLFYRRLTGFQKNLYTQLLSGQSATGKYGQETHATLSLPPALDDVDLGLLLSRWPPFMDMLVGAAPAVLAGFARELKTQSLAAGAALLRAAWPANLPATADDAGTSFVGAQCVATTRVGPTLEGFCAHAFLQPFAEFLADRAEISTPPVRRPICPYCGSPPLVGVLRPEGEGAKRSLVCSFCRTEWDYLRIACPACDERREEKLCVYTTPKFEAVRVEACATCRAYTLTVDLTKDGLAVPEVDELAALPLTLWADEQGYQKFTRSVVCV